ncbi:hypothetical protein ASPZODRAFT_131189 [Penicilliopsis zonata CBS 506.65]|uniref:Uncharacterized protein n=1 Tax=Penicilliopsis zonata CBS 506.65 TaxID=1073090 RepID=A0A1L9SKA2_9EURO|nr:hypothetical protein ASPZODRAFT_131189 [Penicilliopsis zonata CBS 506.65]OJJ47640.1 hypothetical protein ASPZODRAFT_131189 [Penicilliopsis zonata CBS 506.65]
MEGELWVGPAGLRPSLAVYWPAANESGARPRAEIPAVICHWAEARGRSSPDAFWNWVKTENTGGYKRSTAYGIPSYLLSCATFVGDLTVLVRLYNVPRLVKKSSHIMTS